jgi:XTP/dITP diphosphohydrolase
MNPTQESFQKLLDIMDELREKCPWDKKQTFESLRIQTIEETYELCDAILEHDLPNIRKELGDLLLHVVFYARLGQEEHAFGMKEIIDSLTEKLIFRHPHVFGEVTVRDAGEVKTNWEALKMKEGRESVLEGVPTSLPAMVKSYRIQDKVRSSGFDWEEPVQVWDKVSEEIGEVRAAILSGQQADVEDEFGDLLFSVVNAARLYKVDPESALERTNKKFMRRFRFLEQKAQEQGRSLKDMTLAEMEVLWEQAKSADLTTSPV